MAKHQTSQEQVATAELITQELAELKSLTVDELRDRLAQSFGMIGQNLVHMAAIVRELEERGEDLTDLRVGMIRYLRKIAYGQIAPEIVVRFGEFPMLVDRISALPMPDQRKLAGGEPIQVMLLSSGGADHRLLDPLSLTRDQIVQVFAKDHIRTDAEQVAWLESRRQKPRDKAPTKKARVRPDRDRDGLVIGRSFAPTAEVIAALAQLRNVDYDPDLDAEETRPVVIQMTEAEHRQLKVRAVRSGTSMVDLVRRALLACGLIQGKDGEE